MKNKKIKIPTFKRNNSYDWVHFSHNYLKLAKLGCQEILNPKHNSAVDKFKLKYKPYDLFISIIFNIKHGIEVFTKTLKIILTEKLIDKTDQHHNISELFYVLKKEIKKFKIDDKIKKDHLKNPKDTNLECAHRSIEKKGTVALLDEIENLIFKYYHCEILTEKLNSGFENKFTIEDSSNTAFKYPENNLVIKLHYDEILTTITEDDIREILKDVEILLEKFNDLGFVFDIYKQHAK